MLSNLFFLTKKPVGTIIFLTIGIATKKMVGGTKNNIPIVRKDVNMPISLKKIDFECVTLVVLYNIKNKKV